MHTIDLIVIVGYLLVTLAVGLYQGRKVKSMKDYAIADRNYSTPILICTIMATLTGGENTIGIAEKVFNEGVIYILICMAFPLSTLMTSLIAARRIDNFQGCYTVGDIMETNFGKAGKVITGFAGTLLSIGYVGVQVGSTGFLLSYFLSIPYEWGVWIGSGLVVLYTVTGGIRSVTITDVVQFFTLLVTLPVICNFGLKYFGGYEELLSHIPAEKLDLSPSTISYSHYSVLFLIFCIPFLDPTVTQRMLMSKDGAQIRKSLNLTAMLEVPFYLTIGLIALISLALAPDLDPNNIFPYLIDKVLPVGFKGLVVIGLLAVIMSTADSFLNVAGITFIHDFVKPLMPDLLRGERELHMTRLVTTIIGVFSIIAALRMQSIMELVLDFLNVWGPVVVIPLFATLFGVKANVRIFLSSIGAGLFVFVLWRLFDLENRLDFDSLLPSMFANGVVFFGSVFLSNQKHILKKVIVPPIHHGAALQAKFPWIKEFLSESSVPPYWLFGIYALANYVFPYFLWPEAFQLGTYSLFLKLFAALLLFSLLFLDQFSEKRKEVLLVYWYGVLLYCLPFLSTYMLLLNDFHWFWISQSMLSVLILSLLVNSHKFLFLLVGGSVIGIASYFGMEKPTGLLEGLQNIVLPLGYIYVFAITFGFIFSRRRERLNEDRQQTLKSMAGAIAHEVRTPLATVSINGSLIDQYVQDLRAALRQPIENKLSLESALTSLTESGERLIDTSKRTNNLINLLLTNLKQDLETLPQTQLSMKEVLAHTMEDFAFMPDEREKVHVEIQDDFTFQGNQELVTHIFFNLIKNSFYFIQAAGKGEIFITVQHNTVIVKDTGPGIETHRLKDLFTPFYSQRPHGTGIGLTFCKRAMESMQGEIKVASTFGEHTTFTLIFPEDDGNTL